MSKKVFPLAALLIIAVAFSGCTQPQQENNGQTPLGDNNPALNNNTMPAGQTGSDFSGTPAPGETDDASTQGIDDAINELDQIE